MVTKIRKGARRHLYIEEHMAAKGLTDEKVAGRIGVARETVTRWRGQQHRLNPEKISALTEALGLESPAALWTPPNRPSLDALVANVSDDLRQRAAEMVSILVRTGTR